MPRDQLSHERLRAIRAAIEGHATFDVAHDELLALLDEVEQQRIMLAERVALHDTLLAKDFLALYGYAAAVTAWHAEHDWIGPELAHRVEGLALQLARLAPLHDDIRRTLALLALRQRDDVTILSLPIAGRLALVLRELAPLVGVPFADVALLALIDGADDLIDRFVADDAAVARLRREVQRSMPMTRARPAHSVNVRHPDGSTSIECDHTFKGTSHCVHCGIAYAELVRLARVEATTLQATVAPQVVTPVDPIAPVELDVVSIPLGPALHRRVQALVATGRLGRSLAHVAQTLFVLGLFEAEGQDPRAHFGEPKQHISVDGAFLRFALPHEGPRREDILRGVFAWLHAWLGEDDPLSKAPAAALAALPR